MSDIASHRGIDGTQSVEQKSCRVPIAILHRIGVRPERLIKVHEILPTADGDIASGLVYNLKGFFPHEGAPIADRRYRVASGRELCALFRCAWNIADRR